MDWLEISHLLAQPGAMEVAAGSVQLSTGHARPMSTEHRAPVCDQSSLEAISKGPAPLTAGAMAALLSEVHASLLVHEDLSHLADELENVLFDVMIHARERSLTLNRQKPQLVLAK
jgi:hypothetical protein